jgi:hypothetical protein
MTRSRKPGPRTGRDKLAKAEKVVTFPEPTTAKRSAGFLDAVAAVRIADAGIAAIMAAAAEQGLEGDPWEEAVLRPKITDVVAQSLLMTPGWLTRAFGPKPSR